MKRDAPLIDDASARAVAERDLLQRTREFLRRAIDSPDTAMRAPACALFGELSDLLDDLDTGH